MTQQPAATPPDVSRKIFFGRALSALLARGSAAGAAIAMNLFVARSIAVADFGVFSLALVWVTIAGTIGAFGTDVVVTRFLAPAVADGDHERSRDVIRWGVGVSFKFGILAAACSGLLILALFRDWSLEHRAALVIVCVAVPFYSMSLSSVGLLKGVARPSFSIAVETLFRPLLICMFVFAAIYLARLTTSSFALATIIVVSQAIVFGVSWIGVPRELRKGLRGRDLLEKTKRDLMVTAVPVAAMNALLVAMSMLDTVWVGYLAGPATAGVYRVAVQLSNLITFALTATSASIAPKIAQLCSTGERAELQRVLRLAAINMAGLALVGACGLVLLAPHVLALYGSAFESAYPVFCLLVGAQLVNVLSGPTGMLVIMAGHERVALRVSLLATGLVATTGLLLIPRFGAYGAAIASATGNVTLNVVLLVFLWKELHVDTSVLSVVRRRSF